MSIKGTLFGLLSSRLQNKLKFDQTKPGALPDLRWVGVYNSQQVKLAKEQPIVCPAILIEYGPFIWKTTSKSIQQGIGPIRIHVVLDSYTGSFSDAINQQKALTLHEYNEAVQTALEGFSGPGFTAFTRTSDTIDFENDLLIMATTEYQVQLLDESADESKSHVLIDPELVVKRGSLPAPTSSAGTNFVL